MAILIGTLVYVLALFAAAFYGCLGWFFPKSLVIMALALGAWAAWSLATLTFGAGGAATAWWTANRARFIRAAIIFAILATLILMVWYTRSSWAPPCAGVTTPTVGCPGVADGTPVAPVTPEHHTTTPVASAPVVLPDPTSEVITLTTEWTRWYEVPVTRFTGRIVAGQVDKTLPYQYMLDDEKVETVPGGVMPFKELPEFTKIRFRALANEPPVIFVVTTCPAKDNCPK